MTLSQLWYRWTDFAQTSCTVYNSYNLVHTGIWNCRSVHTFSFFIPHHPQVTQVLHIWPHRIAQTLFGWSLAIPALYVLQKCAGIIQDSYSASSYPTIPHILWPYHNSDTLLMFPSVTEFDTVSGICVSVCVRWVGGLGEASKIVQQFCDTLFLPDVNGNPSSA